jgi:3-oxoacyl-[acyl-carrier protein] reductase
MDLQLKGKVALVTGASRGLGAATARQLAREGVRVAINARNVERLHATAASIRQETGAQVAVVPGDVGVAADVARLTAETVGQFGGLDILITNAGGPPPGRFDELDDTAWERAITAMLMGAVRLIRAALPYLRQSQAAAVLTLTSYSVKQPLPNLVLSNSVRLAVIGLTKSLALELGPAGIRFNSILPASTETERMEELLADRARRAGVSVDEETRKQVAASPFGRMATPQEFANVATFLCSPAASYVTGVMLAVDGGMYKGTM